MEWKKIVAAHPLTGLPYDKLKYVRLDKSRVPLYEVEGCNEGPASAYTALGRAFAKHGGSCFYCSKSFKPQPLRKDGPHRDHVVARSRGGTDLLHNLVIACARCGRDKGRDDIHDYKPRAAKAYFVAIAGHVAACVRREPRSRS